jgi:hypothetical protein
MGRDREGGKGRGMGDRDGEREKGERDGEREKGERDGEREKGEMGRGRGRDRWRGRGKGRGSDRILIDNPVSNCIKTMKFNQTFYVQILQLFWSTASDAQHLLLRCTSVFKSFLRDYIIGTILLLVTNFTLITP